MTFGIAKMPGETRPHGRKVLWNRTVHAQFGPVARRVEIAAGGDHQAELAGQDRQGTDLFGRLHAIDHLDGVSAGLEKVGDQAPALGPGEIIMIRVRQADPGARLAQAADHFLQGRPVLLDVSQLAGPQPLAERVGAILDPAALDQELGEMRPRRRVAAVAQGLLDRPRALQRTGHTLGSKPPVDFLGARPAAPVQGFGRLAQGSGVEVETVAQHMNGGTAPGAGQLDTVDQFDTESSGRLVGFRQAFQGVVVGQRQQPDAFLVGPLHQGGGREHAIGGGTVAMQIDTHG